MDTLPCILFSATKCVAWRQYQASQQDRFRRRLWPALIRASVNWLLSELSPSAATALASTSCRACMESTLGPSFPKAFKKDVRLGCSAKESHLYLCLH